MSATPPSSRDDFQIALVCALPTEFNAAALIFDEFWDDNGDQYGKARGDTNEYTTGRIGDYNVVLVLLSKMGKASAASSVANLRSSYGRLRLALLVGVCGGAPSTKDSEIFLGDVVISETLVQYDFGRKYDGRFVRKDTVTDNLGLPAKHIRSLLAIIKTERRSDKIETRTVQLLREMQHKVANTEACGKYNYPGMENDKLYEAGYHHKHHWPSSRCKCNHRSEGYHRACKAALKQSCAEVGCDDRYVVPRSRLGPSRPPNARQNETTFRPKLHIGAVASGDTVLKSAADRDRLVKEADVIAFEMEGAGIWEELPCIVVKGVCDYADSHKHKGWQNFAAATAASASKAIIESYIQTDKSLRTSTQGYWMVPSGRNENFIGREDLMDKLINRIPPISIKDDCQRTAVEGLGGIGKTQIALEAAFRVRELNPLCSVFWVPAISTTTFDNAYRDIGHILKLKCIESGQADIRGIIQRALSDEAIGPWLMIIDNADDPELLFGPSGLCHYFPHSRYGSILITTRNHQVAVRLDVPRNGALQVEKMTRPEAARMLETMLSDEQLRDASSTNALLDLLDDLPLAIKQAGSFLNMNVMSTKTYLKHCQTSDSELIRLLSSNFEDNSRDSHTKNPIATTWLISFESLARHHPLAGSYLQLLSFVAPKDIPKGLLPRTDDPLEADRVIGILKAYSFISESGDDLYTIHRLVHLATQNWVHQMGQTKDVGTYVIQLLSKRRPGSDSPGFTLSSRRQYLLHAQVALEYADLCDDIKAKLKLLLGVGSCLRDMGKDGEAEQIYRQAILISENTFGKLNYWTIEGMDGLSIVLQHLEMFSDSEKLRRQVINLSDRLYGTNHPSTLQFKADLAEVLRLKGNYMEAEGLLRDILPLQESLLHKNDFRILHTREYLAYTLACRGDYQSAEHIYRRILEQIENLEETDGRAKARIMGQLGIVLFDQHKYREGEASHIDAITMYKIMCGNDHTYTLIAMVNLADCLQFQQRNAEAKEIYEHTLELAEATLGNEPIIRSCKSGLELVRDAEYSSNEHKLHGKKREKESRHRYY